MKTSRIKRRTRTRHQLANAEHAEYIAWIHTQPCAACGYRGEAIHAAHVGRGGMGMKHGSDAEVIPLCGQHWHTFPPPSFIVNAVVIGCHAEHDQLRGRFRIGGTWKSRREIRDWDAHQVAVHRGRFEARNEHTRDIPF